jgi:hypothetical protein
MRLGWSNAPSVLTKSRAGMKADLALLAGLLGSCHGFLPGRVPGQLGLGRGRSAPRAAGAGGSVGAADWALIFDCDGVILEVSPGDCA